MKSMVDTDFFLRLVRLGLGKHDLSYPILNSITEQVDWQAIETLALQQGLSAVIVDGVEKLSDDLRPPKEILLKWIGETLQGYEYRYELYRRTIAEIAQWYNSHGYKMMVLKGLACCLDWPKSEHRPCGDIDIWLFGRQKEADAALESEKSVQGVQEFKVDRSHHHHTVFFCRDFMVENHYDFVNTHDYQSSKELEVVFKELGTDDTHFIEVYGEKIYLPSPNLHALFLIRHLVAHFASTSITLRQVLDWAFFVEKHTNEIDWKWLIDVLKKYHMIEFYNTINAISVGDLGFDAKYFPNVQFRPDLKDKVLNDILYPKYSANEPSHLIPRLLYKYRRWQGNAWKQELCYSESRWSAFWSGVWGHLLKPKSI